MKYMHIRRGSKEDGFDDKAGAVTAAYELSKDALGEGSVALVGLALCSPREAFWRKKGNSIAKTRLKSNPILLIQEEGFSEEGLYSILRSIFLDPPDWTPTESLPFQPRFEAKVYADILGPGGTLVRAELDVRGKRVPGEDPDEAEFISLRSWAIRFPSWTQEWAKGME